MKYLLHILYILSLCILLPFTQAKAQHTFNPYQPNGEEEKSHWAESDTIEKKGVPIGQFVWTVDQRFGSISPAEPDTLQHHFNQQAFTEGLSGHYNTTGNLGSPRMSRLFAEQISSMFEHRFIFQTPYDFFITQPNALLYTNTKSPFVNLTYHSCGNKQNGEDRIRGLYYVNVNKKLGVGFKLDYLYGRGYYTSQSTAHFNATFYGSYRSERYDMHTQYYANHLKNSENGGIEEDTYITQPEAYPTKYGTADMPTQLTKTWNKLNVNTFFLTHRYKLGYYQGRDQQNNVVKKTRTNGKNKLLQSAIILNDSTQSADIVANDTLAPDSTILLTEEFVPVASIIHTMRVDHNNRRFLSNLPSTPNNPRYFNDYYLPGDSANDFTKNINISNTLALEVSEGFSKWAKSAVRLYARHDFLKYTLPTEAKGIADYKENYLSVGAQLQKEQGKIFHYNVLGELRTSGKNWGEFNAEGNAQLNIPLRKDTLHFGVSGYVRGEEPSFYYKHYHGKYAWWDNDLDREFRARIGASLAYKKTRLMVHLETIQNYTYFGETLTPNYSSDDVYLPLHSVQVKQSNKNIQLLSATLCQDFRWGILNWENEFTYQVSSNKQALPVPLFNAYSNLYLKFAIAKVLHTEIGADVRYFTKYDAPTYSPIIGQFCTQDIDESVAIGNYPIVNAYLNFRLQHTRFYIMASHVNYSSGSGNPFALPHYPLNRMVIRFGISWNFFN